VKTNPTPTLPTGEGVKQFHSSLHCAGRMEWGLRYVNQESFDFAKLNIVSINDIS